MGAVLFTMSVLLAVVGLSAVMNAAVRRMTYVSARRSARLLFVKTDDFEMSLRSAAHRRHDDCLIACVSGMTDIDEEACRTLCAELGIICCDRSTLHSIIDSFADA